MRALRALSVAAATTALAAPGLAARDISEVTGIPVPELAGVDQIVIDFMDLNGIKAGVVGIIKDGVIIYQRGFDTPENTTLRVASVEKPFTAAAIHILESWGFLDFDDHVFDLGLPGGGILNIPVFEGALGDLRLEDITVQHVLEHKGGWDRDLFEDPMFLAVEIAGWMNVPSPPTREQTASYWLSMPLQHEPGTTYAYSNFGYMCLGLIIKELTGLEPHQFIRNYTVTMNDWVPATEVIRGRSLKPNRYFRERGYTYVAKCENVFDPKGPNVPCPDGGWNLEGMAGHGNLVLSTTPILRLMDRHTVAGSNIGAFHNGSPVGVAHSGALHGSSSMAQQRSDGVHIAVIYNHRSKTVAYAEDTTALISAWLSANVAVWPTDSVDGFWVDFAAAPSTFGGYNDPFANMDDALDTTTHGTKLRFKAGSSGLWSGTMNEKMLLDAPFGAAVIGQ